MALFYFENVKVGFLALFLYNIFDYGCSKKVTNTTSTVVNATQASGADQIRLISLFHTRISAVNGGLCVLFAVSYALIHNAFFL